MTAPSSAARESSYPVAERPKRLPVLLLSLVVVAKTLLVLVVVVVVDRLVVVTAVLASAAAAAACDADTENDTKQLPYTQHNSRRLDNNNLRTCMMI